ncbi:hypothetical protein ILUMI_21514 [Ignelater luminosus]|uniref:Uncharacterized protein n=1 Tax=Ignelater luminosus TaxID=2038154 RepID=A0A8K0G3M5_IGNLU|nr:hypothetical protein ILUMI_21514 [Ignelater luminosus]
MDTKIQIKEATRIDATVCKIERQEIIMKNKDKLRSLQEKVYINSELTKGEQKTQKKLKEIADNERKNGKQVKMGHHKVMIDEREYRWKHEDGKLKEHRKDATLSSTKN